ncbi:hypothetical protein LY625_07160 [Lysobacter sp. GX 14042]|uniref:hypothetical protein n=1 Tax=Lysobacter sp. GX 14042 TaxID=2907155 RepID=UPI001F326B30|nr:hypothetical protein [Lysobacter sp. GX 14042]MCE7032401.1 hypothetical protein [Lysobacter sp. GX 14042]
MTELLGGTFLLLYSAPAAFAFFSAWWAQQTGRNPWLWFVLGLVAMPLAGVLLLMLNRDRAPAPAGEDLGKHLSIHKDIP